MSKTMMELYGNIRKIIEQAKQKASYAVNFAMVEAYWNIGRLIVEYEQKGKKRAKYGAFLIKELSEKLTDDFGEGYDKSNLKRMRQFYLAFPSLQSPNTENEKGAAVRHLFTHPILRKELSWTHYKLLISVEKPDARQWYLEEAANCGWSTRALERQINTFYYERLLSGRDKESVKAEAEQNTRKLAVKPKGLIKDSYVLEFLNLSPDLKYLEKEGGNRNEVIQ